MRNVTLDNGLVVYRLEFSDYFQKCRSRCYQCWKSTGKKYHRAWQSADTWPESLVSTMCCITARGKHVSLQNYLPDCVDIVLLLLFIAFSHLLIEVDIADWNLPVLDQISPYRCPICLQLYRMENIWRHFVGNEMKDFWPYNFNKITLELFFF